MDRVSHHPQPGVSLEGGFVTPSWDGGWWKEVELRPHRPQLGELRPSEWWNCHPCSTAGTVSPPPGCFLLGEWAGGPIIHSRACFLLGGWGSGPIIPSKANISPRWSLTGRGGLQPHHPQLQPPLPWSWAANTFTLKIPNSSSFLLSHHGIISPIIPNWVNFPHGWLPLQTSGHCRPIIHSKASFLPNIAPFCFPSQKAFFKNKKQNHHSQMTQPYGFIVQLNPWV